MLFTVNWSSCYTSNRTYSCIVKRLGNVLIVFKQTDVGLWRVGVEKWAVNFVLVFSDLMEMEMPFPIFMQTIWVYSWRFKNDS